MESRDDKSSLLFNVGAVLLLAVSVLIVYSNTFDASFHFDDIRQIVDNPRIRKFRYLTDILFQEQRGVTFHTFAINYAIGGLNVTGYHVVNVAIHIINSVLLYFVLFMTMTSAGLFKGQAGRIKAVALFSALLFAVHPVQTQAVTYIVQRMESLSALFFLTGLFFFIIGAGADKGFKSFLLYAAVILSYILGFYSKEIVITLPAIILLYDFYFIARFDIALLKGRLLLYIILGALLIYFAVSTVVPLGGFSDMDSGEEEAVEVVAPPASAKAPAVSSRATTPPSKAPARAKPLVEKPIRYETAGFAVKELGPKEYLYTQFNAITYYIALLAVPVNQNLDYDFPVSKSFLSAPAAKGKLNYPQPPPVLSFIILLAIIALAFYLAFRARAQSKDRSRLVSFAIFWFFIVLSPTSSFIPIIDVIFEHRLYLASAGFFIVLVLLIDWIVSTLSGGEKDSIEGS